MEQIHPSDAAFRGHKKRLVQAEKRLGELDRLFIRISYDLVGFIPMEKLPKQETA